MVTIGADFPQPRQAIMAKLADQHKVQRPISSVRAPWRRHMIGDLLVSLNEDTSK